MLGALSSTLWAVAQCFVPCSLGTVFIELSLSPGSSDIRATSGVAYSLCQVHTSHSGMCEGNCFLLIWEATITSSAFRLQKKPCWQGPFNSWGRPPLRGDVVRKLSPQEYQVWAGTWACSCPAMLSDGPVHLGPLQDSLPTWENPCAGSTWQSLVTPCGSLPVHLFPFLQQAVEGRAE